MRLKPVEEQVVALMGASSGIGRETVNVSKVVGSAFPLLRGRPS
jgi:NADP-dependent 3-hydroxy acid dehydrogenase YdfG